MAKLKAPIQDLTTHPTPYVSIDQVSAYFMVDRRTVLRWVINGSLPATRAGRQWRIKTTALREFERDSRTARRPAAGVA